MNFLFQINSRKTASGSYPVRFNQTCISFNSEVLKKNDIKIGWYANIAKSNGRMIVVFSEKKMAGFGMISSTSKTSKTWAFNIPRDVRDHPDVKKHRGAYKIEKIVKEIGSVHMLISKA